MRLHFARVIYAFLISTAISSPAISSDYFDVNGNVIYWANNNYQQATPPNNNSTWIFNQSNPFTVGYTADGYFTVKNGGLFDASGSQLPDISIAATYLPSKGVLTVTGAGSQVLNSRNINIGEQVGDGALHILNGGYVHGYNVFTGKNSSNPTDMNQRGTILVDGPNSRLEVTGMIINGNGGNGHIIITNGGRIDTSSLHPAYTLGTYASSYITVDGAGSRLNITSTSSFNVGQIGEGHITLSNGGTLSNSNPDFLHLVFNSTVEPSKPRTLNIGSIPGATPVGPGYLEGRAGFSVVQGSNDHINFNHTGQYNAANNTVDYTFTSRFTLNSGNLNINHYAGSTLFDSIINSFGTGTLSVNLYGGTMFLGRADTFTTQTPVKIFRGGTLNINGFDQTIYGIVNEGHISFGRGIGTTLTIDGDYDAGNLASMAIETSLYNDKSVTDRMVVTGNTSGTTYLRVHNRNGLGASTEDGINIIEVQGASNGNFILMGDFVTDGHQAIASGAYTYSLEKGAIAPATRALEPGNWYLRSLMADINGDGKPDNPVLQPGVSVYEAYPQALLAMNDVPTLQQRLSNRRGPMDDGAEHFPFWFYTDMHKIKIDPRVSTTNTDFDTKFMAMRGGVDGPIYTTDAGRLLAGLGVHYMKGRTQTQADPRFFGKGHIDTTGFGLMPSLTWHGAGGFYADAIAQATWYQSKMSSNKIGTLMEDGNDAFGYAVSAEIGQKWPINANFNFKLDGQISYSDIYFDQFTDDLNAAFVKNNEGKSILGRIGATISYTNPAEQAFGQKHFYVSANLYNEFIDRTKVTISDTMGLFPVEFVSERERVWGGVNLGGTYSWAQSKYSVYGELGGRSSIKDFGDSYNLSGQVGMKIKF